MLDAVHHVEINGVRYRLAEGAEGRAYSQMLESLRPPNAVTVQGETGNVFQVRPDTLLWSLTDWSGGEGQRKFDPQAPNRWRVLHGVRVFQKPGTLSPGFYVDDMEDSSGRWTTARGPLTPSYSSGMWLWDSNSDNFYAWSASSNEFSSAIDLGTGGGDGLATEAALYDGRNHYIIDTGQTVWEVDLNGFSAEVADMSAVLTDHDVKWMVDIEDQLFIFDREAVGQVSKATGSTGIAIDEFAITIGQQAGSQVIVAVGSKVCVVVTHGTGTDIREITPNSAATPGFGILTTTIPGFFCRGAWSNSGVMYLYGTVEDVGSEKGVIYYLIPEESYGTLGFVREGEDLGIPSASNHAARLTSSYFVVQGNQTDGQMFFEVDAISGGFSCVAYNEEGLSRDEEPHWMTVNEMGLFASLEDNSAIWADPSRYTLESYVISPWHDFGLAGTKILSTLEVAVEALPADWTVSVDYATDNTDSWTTGLTYSTDGGTGTSAVISTDVGSVEFRTLSIRIRMEYTGAGVPTSSPTVLGVDIAARVIHPIRRWNLLLDLADSDGQDGETKIANLVAAGQSNAVVDFTDGYTSHGLGAGTSYDVVVDSYDIDLERAGEGVATVSLLEVT